MHLMMLRSYFKKKSLEFIAPHFHVPEEWVGWFLGLDRSELCRKCRLIHEAPPIIHVIHAAPVAHTIGEVPPPQRMPRAPVYPLGPLHGGGQRLG